jgi:hypothetical protein
MTIFNKKVINSRIDKGGVILSMISVLDILDRTAISVSITNIDLRIDKLIDLFQQQKISWLLYLKMLASEKSKFGIPV